MKEHIYMTKPGRIISQSFLTWLFVAIQLGVNVMMIATMKSMNHFYAIVFTNIALGSLTVFAVQLFINYYKYAADKKFIITYNSVKLIDERTGTFIELKSAEIEKIVFVYSPTDSKFPWSNHAYFVLFDTAKNTIVVNSYIMDIHELWLDSLARRISSKKLIREERYFPIIR
jgi:hypothetical protein